MDTLLERVHTCKLHLKKRQYQVLMPKAKANKIKPWKSLHSLLHVTSLGASTAQCLLYDD